MVKKAVCEKKFLDVVFR